MGEKLFHTMCEEAAWEDTRVWPDLYDLLTFDSRDVAFVPPKQREGLNEEELFHKGRRYHYWAEVPPDVTMAAARELTRMGEQFRESLQKLMATGTHEALCIDSAGRIGRTHDPDALNFGDLKPRRDLDEAPLRIFEALGAITQGWLEKNDG